MVSFSDKPIQLASKMHQERMTTNQLAKSRDFNSIFATFKQMIPQITSAQEVLDFSSFLSKISQFKNPNFTLTHQAKTEFMLRAIPIVI